MNNNTGLNSTDTTRFTAAKNGTIWDPRADLDDDGGAIDADDQTAYNAKYSSWSGTPSITVAQPVSDVGNPFGWQGRVHFNLDYCSSDATAANLMLIDHRFRMHDPVIGRWLTRDPAGYAEGVNLYQYVRSRPTRWTDPFGLACCQLPDGSGTDSLNGICPNDSGQADPYAFQKTCVAMGGTYTKCDCVPNSQGCSLEQPDSADTSDCYCHDVNWSDEHVPPASDCVRGYGPNEHKQCCYDSKGCLLGDNQPGAGSWDIVSPFAGEGANGVCDPSWSGFAGHFWYDWLPYQIEERKAVLRRLWYIARYGPRPPGPPHRPPREAP